MQLRNLGTQGLKTSQLGLGCMGMSEFYGAGDDAESIRVIHRAIELGVVFLDTSDMYGPYTNEELVGKAINGKRDQVTLATKFGIVRNPTNPTVRGFNGKPDYVKKSCEGSLKRLKVDMIDLYYLHRVDPATPIEETVGAMADLVKEGKVRALGLSEATRLPSGVHIKFTLFRHYKPSTRYGAANQRMNYLQLAKNWVSHS